ncbi:esterase/lipase family protein [Winogradskya humida]|uniref:AB hydrolase-1 domain-containing protein n=1 Tax=Winogradskya humida TaxID=113566 RepID=A0ABQ4A5E2_9ACTN|nr:alpha/beta hydrolase [Actinoplanes humidus]GIE26054.1 hypothetical protein Ahu01nite_091560 [Actinoplanes humidus]
MAGERTPIVFIHGLWLHASSWGPWVEFFREAGYEPVAPGWPGEPDTVEEARANPDAVAGTGIDDAVAHYATIIESLPASPIIIGHSFGGLVAEKLLGQGVGVAAVAVDPAQIKGVFALPFAQLRSALPALRNPANLHRAVSLSREEWRYGIGNEVSEQESGALFDAWSIPAPARPVFQVSAANFAVHSAGAFADR